MKEVTQSRRLESPHLPDRCVSERSGCCCSAVNFQRQTEPEISDLLHNHSRSAPSQSLTNPDDRVVQ